MWGVPGSGCTFSVRGGVGVDNGVTLVGFRILGPKFRGLGLEFRLKKTEAQVAGIWEVALEEGNLKCAVWGARGVHLERSTCHLISGRGEYSTRIVGEVISCPHRVVT
jgi:hypothetical protein